MDHVAAETWEPVGFSPGAFSTLDSNEAQDLVHRKTSTVTWGRNLDTSWAGNAYCVFMFIVPPTLTFLGWITLERYDGSLSAVIYDIHHLGMFACFKEHAPSASPVAALGYSSWVLFQSLLYTYLPGRSTGQLTPAGFLLEYHTNGLLACLLTLAAGLTAFSCGVLDPSIIAKHWEGLVVVLNAYGLLLTVAAFVKAHFAPSHVADRKFSGMFQTLTIFQCVTRDER